MVSLSVEQSKEVAAFLEQSFPDGLISAREVLSLAKPLSSPIHQYFTWNDGEAAEAYRLYEARVLIRSVVVEFQGEQYRKYVSPVYIEELDEKRYVEITKARGATNLWEQVLEKALRDAVLWRERYEKYERLKPIVQAINKVEKELTNAKTKIKRKRKQRKSKHT